MTYRYLRFYVIRVGSIATGLIDDTSKRIYFDSFSYRTDYGTSLLGMLILKIISNDDIYMISTIPPPLRPIHYYSTLGPSGLAAHIDDVTYTLAQIHR